MDKIYARLAWNGKRIPVHQFTTSMYYKFKDESEEQAVRELTAIKWEEIPDIDNGEIYEWYQVCLGSDRKYGRYMYCPKTKTLRTQTLEEFYQNSTVD